MNLFFFVLLLSCFCVLWVYLLFHQEKEREKNQTDISFLAHFLAPFVLVILSFLLNSPQVGEYVSECVCVWVTKSIA